MRRTAPFALTLVVLAGFAVATTVAAAVLGNPEVASVFDNGAHGNRDARGAAVSAAGRYVAFTSTAALAGVPTARVLQLYVRDRVAGRTLLASANAAGQAADDDVDDPSAHRAYAISGDGRYAVFASRATNLVDDDRDGADMDVFRKDLVTGAVALVSRAPGGVQANGSVAGDPDVSYDGSRVVFETGSGATNLWPDDTDNASDIVMRDIAFDTNVLVSVTGAGLPASQVGGAAISADGRHVAFEAGSAVLVRDLATSSTITAASTGAAPDISGDGQVVAYEAGSVRARALGASEEIIASAGSAPSISADGRRVAFEGARPNAPFVDVYVRDRPGGATQRVSERLNGTQVDHDSTRGAISGNGAIVAFGLNDAGPGPSLAADDTNGLADVLVATLAPSDATGPQVAVAAPADGAAVDAATVTVRGTATDPAGIVSVSAGGFTAAVGPAGDFSLEVPLNVGENAVAARAIDGAGNATERILTLHRAVARNATPALKARARALRVTTAGRTTLVRFRLDPGAKRVTTRLWRRVPHAGAQPSWTPVGPLRIVATRPGARTALLSRTPLRPEIYQVRVGVVSAGGVAVTVLRYRVLRAWGR